MKKLTKILALAIVLTSLVLFGCHKMEMENIETPETNNFVETNLINNSVFEYPILKYDNMNSFLNGLD